MKKLRCLLLAILWVLMSGDPARALDQTQPVSDFLQTHFTTEDGLPGAVVDEAVQTKDGFLWLILNGNNLVRFDGKNFYRFLHPRPRSLAVGPDGDLWVGWEQGLIRIPSTTLNQSTLSDFVSYNIIPGRSLHIVRLHFSKSGILWAATPEGLFRYEQDQFVAVGPRVRTHDIKEAPDGHLFVFNDTGFIEVAGSEVVHHPQPGPQLGVSNKDVFDVLKDKNGNTWYCSVMGVARETNGRIEKLKPYARIGQPAFRAYEDSQGTVWIAKQEGLFRVISGKLELVIGEIQVRFLFTDRDGNLWVCTNGNGLYRLKERAVRIFTTADGLPNNLIMTVLATHDGAVWTGANCGGITRFDGKQFQTYNEKNGLLNSCVYALAEDQNHNLWIGTWGGGAFRYHDGSFTQYTTGKGLEDDRVMSIVPARDGSVWFGTGRGLTRLKNQEFRTFTTADGLSSNVIFRVWEDRSRVIWAGTRQGLDRMTGDRFENISSLPKSMILPIGEDRNGGQFFYVEIDRKASTLRLNKDRVETIKQVGGAGMVETERGELWICGTGFGRLQPDNFAQARTRDEPLDYESFSSDDGITAEASGASPCFAQTSDGKLWAATVKGLAMFDLSRMQVTHAKPSIYLTDVTIGRNTQRADREIVVPPGTSHVKIHFAVIEISAPEKIHLQYRLDGVDTEWLDAPDDPSAIYTNIPVGTHALRIRASNRNGIWDRQGVVFMVTQRPFFYQTRWFKVAIAALGALLVIVIYRLRVAQISRQMSARFDERLSERTRVARELHDTLLQTVQGSKMVADHALKNSEDHSRMVRAMEQLSTWLAQATNEGRAALQSLRASTTEKNDLAEAFRRAIDECGKENSAEISFSVNGNSIEMHPVVRDEIYRIGYEAIRNACTHSGANRLEVTLEYAHDLTLRISDNGAGIDSEIVEEGKEGHFGLHGMRERAERIGSKFSLVSSPGSGTVITLVVPGRIVFLPQRHEGTKL